MSRKEYTGYTKKTAIADVPAESEIKYYTPGGEVFRAEMELIAQRMKGYKEYTFAIRQSSTNAPTIYVIRDDFGVTPLTFTRSGVGVYACDISSLSITADETRNILLSNTMTGYNTDIPKNVSATFGATSISLYTEEDDGGYALADAVLTNEMGCIVSIRETLEDT